MFTVSIAVLPNKAPQPNQERYPGQKISVVLIEGYAYLVPKEVPAADLTRELAANL